MVDNYVFRGICRGGPWDGKPHEWARREYRVAMLPKFFPFRPTIELPDRIEPKWGTYRFVLGNWIWRAD